MPRTSYLLLLANSLIYLHFASPCCIADWPQFLGPNRNGISRESGLMDSFPASGPKILWRVPGGVGMSAVVVHDEIAITTWNAQGQQWLVALDSATGKERWKREIAPAYENAMGNGPRATPSIAAGSVYAYSGDGVLVAVDLQTGKLLWRKDVMQELSCEPSEYGMSSSPLVVNERVIVHAGAADGAVAAFSTKDGNLLWKSGSGHAGYSSPALLNIAGSDQVVSFTGSAVLGIEPTTGEALWTYPFETDYGCNTASPISVDGGVFVSAGENHGSALLDVTLSNGDYNVVTRWKSLDSKSVMRNEWQTSIVVGDFLYGFDNVGAAGPVSHFSCIEAKTGKLVWQQKRFGKGNLVYADEKFFLTTIDGELVIAEANPNGFKENSRVQLVGKNRQTISISNSRGYLRDDNEVVCLELKK